MTAPMLWVHVLSWSVMLAATGVYVVGGILLGKARRELLASREKGRGR